MCHLTFLLFSQIYAYTRGILLLHSKLNDDLLDPPVIIGEFALSGRDCVSGAKNAKGVPV